MPDALIQVEGVSKVFPGVVALDDVSLTVRPGEVHALTGENGSGKSTLARIIAGVLQPDAGRLLVDGVPTVLSKPADGLRLGIVMISQELTLAPTLSVAENVFLGRVPRTRWGTVDWGRLSRDAQAALDRLGVHVDPRARVGDLSVELRQEVEIARALSSDARVLILDEATSSLSEAATDRLLQLVEEERDAGVAVLMITHRMPELYRTASVATVLRDGRLVDKVPLPETSEATLVRLMVGREIGDFYGKRAIDHGQTVLEVKGLTSRDGRLRPTSFDVRRGEILGVAGLVGSGKAELGLALGGAIGCEGRVSVGGRTVRVGDPRAAIEGGIGFVPDDRKRSALLPTRSVGENFAVAWMDRLTSAGVLDTRRERRDVHDAIDTYRVVTASDRHLVTTLSGGNQQKVILGRTFALDPDVLVLSEPTRGIDVGAKSEIYRMLQGAAAGGAAIVVISSELPELLGICDRIVVFFEGEVRGEFIAADADEETIAHVAVSGAALARS